MKEKEKTTIKCPYCDKEIVGFSEHHAKQNLMIHQKVSERCKFIREKVKKLVKKSQ